MSAIVGEVPFPGTARFEVIRRLGAGGMGVVYEVHDRERKCRVALKTLRSLGSDTLLRLKNEFRALRDVQHPNLVSLGELHEDGGWWYFTMELVHGVSFTEWVRPGPDVSNAPTRNILRTGSTDSEAPTAESPEAADTALAPAACDESRLRPALAQLAQALAALHAAGKVHRDIKPSNVMVTASGRVVLLDFGVATGTVASDQSTVRHVVGTVEYMAPEQAASKPVGPPADWYAFGVVLFKTLTGRLPFSGAPLQVMLDKQRVEPPPPSAFAPDVPADLDRLCTQLLRFDPAARPDGRTVLVALATDESAAVRPASANVTLSVPFVGRQRELQALRNAFGDVEQGRSVTVLVHGATGVGKSALVRQFADEVRGTAPDAVVLSGRCYERETVPFKAVDGVMDALTRHMMRLPAGGAGALLPRAAALLGQAFPVMRQVREVASAPRVALEKADPQELRSRLFAAVRELFARLADRRPAVLVIDDLQWADQDSLALLAELVRPPDAPGLLVVTTVRRPEELPRDATAGVATFPPVDSRRLRLESLAAPEAHELASRLLEAMQPSVEVSPAEIAREADGHPLFIDELVRFAASWTGPGAPALQLEEALGARIAAVPPEARRVLELVAVADTPVPPAVVARAGALDQPKVDRWLAQLRVWHLVQCAVERGADVVSCYHGRVRDAVLAGLDDAARREHHRELATAIEGWEQAEPQLRAVHWRGAGDVARAVEYFLAAATSAEGALAFGRAVQMYRNALAEQLLEGPARRAVRVRLAHALVNAGRGAEAACEYLAAAAGAADADSVDLRRRAAEQYLRSGHIEEGLTTIGEVLVPLGFTLPSTPTRALLSALLRRAAVRLRGLRFQVREPSQVAPAALSRLDACFSVAATLATSDTIRGTDMNARTLLMALRLGEPTRLVRALSTEAAFVAFGGERAHARATKLADVAAGLAAREPEQHDLEAFVVFARGAAEYYRGRFAPALAHFERGESLLRESCTWAIWELDTHITFVLFCLAYLGRLDDLSRRLPRLLREAIDRGDLYLAAISRLSLPCVAWLLGDDVAEARRMAADALRSSSPRASTVYHWYGLTALTTYDLYAGDGRSAYDRVLETWPQLSRSLILTLQICRIEAWFLRARAALAAAAGSGGARDRLIGEAERDGRRILREKAPWARPFGRAILGSVAAARGRHEVAAGLLADAARGFAAADMALLEAATRARLGQLLGGDAGRAEGERASAWLAGQRVANPARMVGTLLPSPAD